MGLGPGVRGAAGTGAAARETGAGMTGAGMTGGATLTVEAVAVGLNAGGATGANDDPGAPDVGVGAGAAVVLVEGATICTGAVEALATTRTPITKAARTAIPAAPRTADDQLRGCTLDPARSSTDQAHGPSSAAR